MIRIDTLRRLGLGLAALAALAAAGLATTGCREASPTLVDCTGVTSTIQYSGLTATSGPALGNFVADAQVGVALALPAPKLELDSADYPAACVEHPTFTSTALPDGLALDASTGAITGTPTQPGLHTFDLSVTTTGTIEGSVRSARIAFEIQPATVLFTGWDAPRILPGTTGVVAVQGGSLSYLDADTVADTLTLRRSSDTGISWTLATPPVSPPARTGFHVTTDEQGWLYVAGGTSGTTVLDDLWVFDGTAWTQLQAHTPFPSGSALVASAGRLYAVSGQAWRSDDRGLTWMPVAPLWDTASQPDRHAVCGIDLGGTPVFVAEQLIPSTGVPPEDTLFRSADQGASWTMSQPPADGPFASLGGVQGCAVFAGQAILAGQGLYTNGRHDVLASADLVAWTYQPHRFEWFSALQVQGVVTIGSTMFLAENGLLYPDLPLP